MSDFDSFQDQPFAHNADRSIQDLPLHESAYSFDSLPQSRKESRRTSPFPFHNSYFDDGFAAGYPPDRFSPTPPSNFLDTVLNPQSSYQSDIWSFPQPEYGGTPERSSLQSFGASTMSSSRLANGYVDLTADASSPPTQPSGYRRLSKRAVALRPSPDTAAGPSTKRLKRNDGSSARETRDEPRRTSTPLEDIEQIDLVDEKEKEPIQTTLQKQRIEQVKAQEKPSEKPLRLSNLTCVICMDTPTDITATSCGHLFCHTCLMEALIAGENRNGAHEPRRSQCPVCRKVINRNKATDIIPLLMKKGLATQPKRKPVST